jgi:hypothetical protein
MDRIASALTGASRPRVPGGDGARPIHAGRAAGKTFVVLTAGRSARLCEFHGGHDRALELTALPGDWPGRESWLTSPVYTPLAVAIAARERVVWRRTRRKLASRSVQAARAETGEAFLGLGVADGVWLVAARRLADGTLSLEATSGESGELQRLATLDGPVPDDAAVALGGASWLPGLAQAAEAPAESAFTLRHETAGPRLPIRHLWALVGDRLLILDLPNDRICFDVALAGAAAPVTLVARQTARLIEPAVLEGSRGGLYVSVRDRGGVRPVFVPARPPIGPSDLPAPAGYPDLDWARPANLVPWQDGEAAVLVHPNVLAAFVGTQPGEPRDNPAGYNFEPLAAAGFLAGFIAADDKRSRLVIYKPEGAQHKLEPYIDDLIEDTPLETALAPVFTGEELQLLGYGRGHLYALVVPVAKAAAS